MILDPMKCGIFLLVIIYSLLIQSISGEDSFERRKLLNGEILGRKLQTRKNTIAYAYLGVPYGEAASGNLRYRSPMPKQSWSGVLNVQEYHAACMQNSSGGGTLDTPKLISEDCLVVNIITSESCLQSKRCPVIYYIHGGEWRYDSPNMFSVQFLADNFAAKDVLIITVSYRLGSFGFFNTGRKTSADKNVALLDVTEGLRWVQHNVAFFGGDRQKVTIMGHSSGAIIVDLLAIVPSTTGLFHQIVIMSAPLDNPTPTKDVNVAASKQLALRAGCADESSWDDGHRFEEILACLRRKDGHDLLLIQRELEDNNILFIGPAIEDKNGFLNNELRVLSQNRPSYPCVVGTVITEFQELYAERYMQNGTMNSDLLKESCENAVKNRGYRHVKEVGSACVEQYSKKPEDAANLYDDVYFHVPAYELGEILREKGAPVFRYSFEYRGIGNAFSQVTPIILMHAYDMVYVMGLHMGNMTSKDEKIRDAYSSAFVNFVKTGDPTMLNAAKWQSTDERNNYFKIDFDEDLKMPGNTNGYHADAVNFWTVTMKNLDDELEANHRSNLIARYDATTEFSLSSVEKKIRFYVPAGFLFLCLVFTAAVICRSKMRTNKCDPEKTPLNVNAVKLYS